MKRHKSIEKMSFVFNSWFFLSRPSAIPDLFIVFLKSFRCGLTKNAGCSKLLLASLRESVSIAVFVSAV